MILVSIDIDLNLLVCAQDPFILYHKFIVVSSWFELEMDHPIFLTVIEMHLLAVAPVIPATRNANFCRARNFGGFIGEDMLLGFESLSIFEDCLEIMLDIPNS